MPRLRLVALIEGVADFALEGLHGLDLADRARELVVEVGQEPLAQVQQLDVEVRLLAAKLLHAIVVREGHVEGFGVADAHAHELLLPAGDHASLADHQRQPVGGAPLEGLAVDGPLELHGRHVPVLGRASIDGP